ncbi:PQQ-dependent sugar dehydrogenase [Niabella sp. CC-SYL272]|uniref:PQQ-dependent sugar dehydrogenase n=1 Tax=Niabella agricola TaxID=2891571 RepID=UPI001F19DD43|nr:PQQ-dependent sugar dehydrogenase [Niabella agricola]MCF3109982.1 PQQ-dependent sugar dehydrogenase [Niabella agricola]
MKKRWAGVKIGTGAFAVAMSFILFQCRQVQREPQTRFNIVLDTSVLAVQELSTNNKVPWELMWGPDHTLWYNEQEGRIYRLDPASGKRKLLLRINDVAGKTTAGLLGMACSAPDPGTGRSYLFAAYTFAIKDSIGLKLVRYLVQKDTLIEPKVIAVASGFRGHYGSRIAILPDHKVYWATGDGAQQGSAQDAADLKGKILRFNVDGSIPADNPVPGSPVWAKGFRNIQGLTFSDSTRLYTSEHGDAAEDEINLVRRGGNFGWSAIEGNADLPDEKAFADSTGAIDPLRSWTPTIAPSGMVFYNHSRIPEWQNSLLLVSLKDRNLRVLSLSKDGHSVVKEMIYLDKLYGRLRAVCVSPEGDIYLSTSNHDWNPYSKPAPGDDKIIRITKAGRITAKLLPGKAPETKVSRENAMGLYTVYCASCHKEDGSGSPGTFPSLQTTPLLDQPQQLIDVFLFGKSTGNNPNRMPSFKFLNNEEAAAVLNFIRSRWGDNNRDSITATAVQERRGIKKKG